VLFVYEGIELRFQGRKAIVTKNKMKVAYFIYIFADGICKKYMKILQRKILMASVIGFLLLMLIVSFILRGVILHKAIGSVNSRIRNREYISHWDGARFKGMNTVFVRGIYFQSKDGENEVFINSISLRVRILPLFFRKLRIKSLECNAITVRIKSKKSITKQGASESADSTRIYDIIKEVDLAELTNKNIRRVFSYTPTRVLIDRMDVRITYSGRTTVIGFHKLSMNHGELAADMKLAGNDILVEIPLAGRFDKTAGVVEVHMANPDTNLLPLPLLKDMYGIATGFDSLSFRIDLSDRSRHLVNMTGNFSFTGFVLNGDRISTSDIKIDYFNSSFLVHLGTHFVEIDSITRAYLNKINFQPYFRFSLGNTPEIRFRLLPVNWDAWDFFSSLPEGMFTSLIGMRAKGTLHYFLDFAVDLNCPDSLTFDTRLHAEPLVIIEYGSDDYRTLNGDFFHHVYERGRMVKSFMVGSGNPDFVPYDRISTYLRAAVMTSEDGSFFVHRGFNPNAFRESIATNIKEGRFARGGSTISMQLVKNIFLTRNKTVARKIEEAIIVWLIENKHLVSKQRMYEVYLNIIEWGPGIYGINQASRFYFNKSPAELSLEESIYLASIVPHPKWYKYTFDSNGMVKPFFTDFFNRLKELMVRKDFVVSQDTIGTDADILLTGPASQVFMAPDTAVVDSMAVDDLEIFPSL